MTSKKLRNYLFYQDDWTTIYCGDCLEIMPLMEPESVDLVVTDPPYGIGKADWDEFNPEVLLLRGGCACFMYCSVYNIPSFQPIFTSIFNLKNLICEHKRNMVMTTWDKDRLQIQWEPIFFGIKGRKARIEIIKRHLNWD